MLPFLIIAAGLLAQAFPSHGVEIVAHRGASADAPENTLASMKLAWTQGADAIELDLWLSKDGKLVVFHDGETKRFDGLSRKVTDLTWAELQQLDVGAWKGPAFKGERIPTLESILATVPAGKRAVLELKSGPEIVPELRRVLAQSGLASRQLAIISFNFASLQKSKAAFADVPHYFLLGYGKDAKTDQPPQLATALSRCREGHLDGLDLHFDWPITRAFTDEVHQAGLKLLVWTVDDPAAARRLAAAGVDGITTNRPQWLRTQLQP